MENSLFEPILLESENYHSILTGLFQDLKTANLNRQVEIVRKLLDLLKRKEINSFIKLIKSVDMWGGAGAVWEVYIEDKNQAKAFEKRIISLIKLMEKTNICTRGIKRVGEIFEKNQRK